MAALAIAMGIGRFAFTPVMPMMQEDFGLSVADAGWLASANYGGYLAGALIAIRTRIQPVIAIRVGLLAICLSTLAMGLGQEFIVWALLRTAAGIASAWVMVFVSSWSLERLALLGRTELGGAIYSGVGVGIVAAGGTCLVVMSLDARSADAWQVLGCVSIAALAVIWPFVNGRLSIETAKVRKAAGPSIWQSNSRRLVLCYGAFGFGYIIPATFLPLMAKALVADSRLFGWAWPVFGAAAFVSTLLAARLARYLSHRRVWAGGHFIMALGVAMPLMVPGLAGIMASALLVGGTFMVITMAGMQEARAAAGQDARMLMAAMTSSFACGQILGPVAVSLLVPLTGHFTPSLVLAFAVLIISAISLQKKETELG
jgi:MFS family permease